MSEPGDAVPPHPGPLPRVEREKKAPRWVIAFLRALERTGKVRASAEDAGIDHTTAYLRQRTHADFAAAWKEALEKHRAERERVEGEEIAAFDKLRMSGAGEIGRASCRERVWIGGARGAGRG